VIECIIKGKEEFKISFGSQYIQSFPERIVEWYEYMKKNNSIYRFFLMHFTPKDDMTVEEYLMIHFGVEKPGQIKIVTTPNEKVLYEFLEKNGFKITEEHLYSTSTVYNVARA